jgi:hypothetical protein
VGDSGLEHPSKTPEKPALGETGGTESGTLADVLPTLPPAVQAEIMALLRVAGKK